MLVKNENNTIDIRKSDILKECNNCSHLNKCKDELDSTEICCYYLYRLFSEGVENKNKVIEDILDSLSEVIGKNK